MTKLSPKAKAVALSAIVASTGVIAYASNEVSKKEAEQNVDTANLIVEKTGKDKVKISVDNVENAVKAFQLRLKIDGNVKFKDSSIKWLLNEDNQGQEKADKDKLVETDYVLNSDNKEIDIFVASESELSKKGRVLEVCEIDVEKLALRSNSSYKIVPNTENSKVAFKSVDTNNNQVEEANMIFDETTLSINTPPTITLKDTKHKGIDKEEDADVEVDVANNTITVKEGYDFNAVAKSFVEVKDEEEENISEDKITVTKVDTSKTGTYNVEYTATDSDGESTTLNVNVLVKPEVWKDEPTLKGVPTDTVEIYTGDIFDPLMPDGNNKITATDVKGNELEVNVGYSDDFNLDQEGEHTITYTAKDRFNNTKSETVKINVRKDEAPVITGTDDIIINKGTTFNPTEGVSATDAENDLTNEIKVSGNVNTNVAGVYPLTYKVSDERNTTTKTRKVTVNDAPTIGGDLSNIILKNGTQLTEEEILDRININDDLDKAPRIKVDLSKVKTSVDGTYTVSITAMDSNNLSTEKEINVVVTSKSVADLPDSGDGSSEEKSVKKQVIDGDVISKINEKLSALTKDYNVESSKTTILDNIVYSIKVSSKPVAFRNTTEKYHVEITVPKGINESTGGIVITQHQGVKVSSVNVTENNIKIEKGETKTLDAIVAPENAENKKLLWSSTNTDVVSITPSDDSQSATIKGLKNGTSTIRVAAIDGSGVSQELIVQVGEQPKEDTEKPVFDYKGKTEITLANGMKFEVPNVTASDNVDTGLTVDRTISIDGKTVDSIDTTVAGTYEIKYTTQDTAGNKAELTITVTVGEHISGITVGSGDAITEDKALEMESTSVDGLNKLVNAIEKGFKAETIGKPEKKDGKVIYKLKLSKKQGLIARLFNLNKNTETYYIKVTVENKPEFTNILDKFNTDGSITNPPVTPPVTPSVPETTVTQLVGAKRFDTAAKISQEGWTTSTNVILVNGNNRNLVDGLTAAPLASAKDAPILLSYDDKLPKETIDEIKRLKASNVILIGGETAMPKSIVDQVKAIDSKINVSRISGLNRYETSLNIAKEIDKTNDITKVYIGAGDGEADALSISPVAGREKAPIILTKKDVLDKNVAEYIKSEKIADAYFIGGERKLDDSVILQVNSITSKDVSNNRIEGETRKDTNAKVIEKFYSNTQLDGVIVAKDLELVDALTVGPLAAKKDIPVIIATDELSKSQEDVLNKKKSPKIYETGGGIKSSVVDKLKQLLNNKK